MARGPGAPPPIGRSIEMAKSQEPKKKSVYVRKEFPETWLWTEEMVKKAIMHWPRKNIIVLLNVLVKYRGEVQRLPFVSNRY